MEEKIDLRQINILVHAFLGDSIYEVYVREHIIKNHPNMKVNKIHKLAVNYVKAESQYEIVTRLHDEDYFTEDEWDIVLRGRNSSQNAPKNAIVSHYNYATGFEAVLGYLYLLDKKERMNQIIGHAIKYIDDKNQ